MSSKVGLRGIFLPAPGGLGNPLTTLLVLNEWFVRLRWRAGLSYGLAVAVMRFVFGVPIAAPELLLVAGVIISYNVVFAFILAAIRRDAAPRQNRLLLLGRVQVVADFVCLTLLIHFTGGVESPLILFYLFHIIIASVILPGRSGYVYATLAVVLYTGEILVDYLVPQVHYHIEGFFPAPQYQNLSFAIGSCFVLAFTAYVSAYLATTIVERMRQREGQLAGAYKTLAETEERKSRFMRSAAHRLRAPLSSIYMCLRAVEGEYVSGGTQEEKELLQRAKTRSLDMLDLVSDLITLARLKDVDLSKTKEEAIAFDQALRIVIDEHEDMAKGKGLEVSVDYGAGGASVWANKDQLREVMSNLVSNAVKYTPEDGHVKIASRCDNGRIELQVSDSGIGIPPDEMEHLFEEFFRATNAKKVDHRGTGLGLCISRELLKRMGGEIGVESRLDEGSTFRVTLPEWRGH